MDPVGPRSQLNCLQSARPAEPPQPGYSLRSIWQHIAVQPRGVLPRTRQVSPSGVLRATGRGSALRNHAWLRFHLLPYRGRYPCAPHVDAAGRRGAQRSAPTRCTPGCTPGHPAAPPRRLSFVEPSGSTPPRNTPLTQHPWKPKQKVRRDSHGHSQARRSTFKFRLPRGSATRALPRAVKRVPEDRGTAPPAVTRAASAGPAPEGGGEQPRNRARRPRSPCCTSPLAPPGTGTLSCRSGSGRQRRQKECRQGSSLGSASRRLCRLCAHTAQVSSSEKGPGAAGVSGGTGLGPGPGTTPGPASASASPRPRSAAAAAAAPGLSRSSRGAAEGAGGAAPEGDAAVGSRPPPPPGPASAAPSPPPPPPLFSAMFPPLNPTPRSAHARRHNAPCALPSGRAGPGLAQAWPPGAKRCADRRDVTSRDAQSARAPRAPFRELRRESRLAAADGAPTRAEVAARSQHGAELSLMSSSHVGRGPAFIGQSKVYYSAVGNAKTRSSVQKRAAVRSPAGCSPCSLPRAVVWFGKFHFLAAQLFVQSRSSYWQETPTWKGATQKSCQVLPGLIIILWSEVKRAGQQVGQSTWTVCDTSQLIPGVIWTTTVKKWCFQQLNLNI